MLTSLTSVQEEDITIPGRLSGKISIRIIRPANSTGSLPNATCRVTACDPAFQKRFEDKTGER